MSRLTFPGRGLSFPCSFSLVSYERRERERGFKPSALKQFIIKSKRKCTEANLTDVKEALKVKIKAIS